MESNENETKKSKKTLLILLAIIGVVLALGGTIVMLVSSPKRVTSAIINKVSANMENIFKNSENVTGISDSFSATSNITFNIQSDYFQSLAQLSPEYAVISKLFTNLNNTENSVVLQQDKKNQKVFMNWNSKLNQQELINTKYLIENNTEYYHINGAVNTYINNGNNNYFESLNSTTSTNDNLLYVVQTMSRLIGTNLKDEYFKESIEGKYRKITLTLNKKNYTQLATNVLAGLKKDKKANKILTGYNKKFASSKITADQFSNKFKIELNIYTDKLFSQPKKYELKVKGEETTSYTYYEEDNQAIIEVKNKDKLTTKMKIESKNDKTSINIFDEKNVKLGTISINRTATNQDILVNMKTNTSAIEINYNSKISNIKKNKAYDMDTIITMKIASNNTNLLNGTISAKTQVSSDTVINEDISNSVLASSITPEQQVLLDQKIMTVLLTLMS